MCASIIKLSQLSHINIRLSRVWGLISILCWAHVLDSGHPNPAVFAEALHHFSLWELHARYLVGTVEYLLNEWTPSHWTLHSSSPLSVTVLYSLKHQHCRFKEYIYLFFSQEWAPKTKLIYAEAHFCVLCEWWRIQLLSCGFFQTLEWWIFMTSSIQVSFSLIHDVNRLKPKRVSIHVVHHPQGCIIPPV